jgi:hypothetical protein
MAKGHMANRNWSGLPFGRLALCYFLQALLLSGAGAAEIVPAAQERVIGVSAYSSGGSNQEMFSAPDFGPFLAISEKTSDGSFGERGAARAFQSSTISGGALVAEGYANATASAGDSSAFALGRAESRYRVEFAVGVPTDIRIVGALRAMHGGNAPNPGQARLELRNLMTGAVIASGVAEYSGPTDVDLDIALALEPGVYQFMVEARGWAEGYAVGQQFCNVFTSYRAELTVVPAPGAIALLAGAGALVPIRGRSRAGCHEPGAGMTMTRTVRLGE